MNRSRKKGNNRSPDHPACDLETAVESLMRLYHSEHVKFVAADQAIQAFGYSPSGSTGQRRLAALIHYGLVDEKGAGTNRLVRISELGSRISLEWARDSDDLQDALQEAALSPDVFQDLWQRWDGQVPSEAELRHYLVFHLRFNENVVHTLINDYLSTLRLAGLLIDTEPAAQGSRGWLGTSEESLRRNQNEDVSLPESQTSLDVSIPLGGGRTAKLTIPLPLSETDFQFLTRMIHANMEALKETHVSRTVPRLHEIPRRSFVRDAKS